MGKSIIHRSLFARCDLLTYIEPGAQNVKYSTILIYRDLDQYCKKEADNQEIL